MQNLISMVGLVLTVLAILALGACAVIYAGLYQITNILSPSPTRKTKVLGLGSSVILKILLSPFAVTGFLIRQVSRFSGFLNSRIGEHHTSTYTLHTTYPSDGFLETGSTLLEVPMPGMRALEQTSEKFHPVHGVGVMQESMQRNQNKKDCPKCLKIRRTLKMLVKKPNR